MGEQRRTVWLVGAGSGMGRAAAVRAASAGWHVAVSGRRTEALAETLREVAAAGGDGFAEAVDVTDAASVARAAGAVLDRTGGLDALVVASGLNDPRRSWGDQSMDSFSRIVDTNLTGVARIIDASLPALRARGGVVVVISSYAGWGFSPGAGVAYGASKTALSTLVRTVNAEEARSGVRACHLCPGDVATDFLEMRPEVPDEQARAVMLQPQDVARMVQFVLDSPAHVRIDELVVSPVAQVP